MLNTPEDILTKELRVNCEKCFGLCCIALFFSASDGFPINKAAGKPCINLKEDFTCSVHKNLRNKGLKGCTSYDCFGAGQKLAQVTYNGQDWRKSPQISNEMFDAFIVMRQLHEMLWYLSQAFILQSNQSIQDDIRTLIHNTEELTLLDAASLLALDIETHRTKVNLFLKCTSEFIRNKFKSSKINNSKSPNRFDYFGADLRKTNLRGADLRGTCLIAANLSGVDLNGADFIGADLRDTNFSGADLTNSIFLTQAQINTAKGDFNTKLPKMLVRPSYWSK
jgi:uncharacterized protein YjbI with pentapeptide repeats